VIVPGLPALPDPARAARTAIPRATAAIVAMGLLWRVVRYLANWPLWGDEAYLAVSLLTRDFAGLARPLEYYQIAPVGFLWVELAAVRLLGAGEWALRLVPFLAGVGSLLLFRRFAGEVLDRRAALMAVGIFAISFYPVRHATEVKPYATDLLLSLVVTCLARRAWDRPDAPGAWLALTTAAAAGVWASYPLIFVAAGVALVLGVRVGFRPSRRLALSLGFGAATLASWAAMYLGFARPQALDAPFYQQMPTWEDAFPPVDRPWTLPWWFLRVHAGNMMAYPYGGNNFGSLATAVLVVIGGLVLWRRDRALLGLLLAPLGPAFVAAAARRYPYGTSARISLFLAPAVCLLAGQGLAALFATRLPRPAARRALLGTTVGFALVALACAVGSVVMPYKATVDRETRRVVRDLVARTGPGDRWIGFNGMVALPKIKQLMLMPWLQHAAEFQFYALRDAPVPIDWMPEPGAAPPATAGRTWFLLHRVEYDRFPSDLLDAHLVSLTARLGTPTVQGYEPTPGETVRAIVFPAPVASASARSSTPR